MNSSPSFYKKFFRPPSTADKLNLFQLLFESSEISPDLALALLKVIHRELSSEQSRERSAYKQYAETIETLRFHRSDMLWHVVDAWNAGRAARDPEWLTDGIIK
ncbi:MAG: hypothetical protein HYU84_10245 [Chloroflexi bacterium]|nr:hypothetical protein [Chloroflexota bacterium]